MLLRKRGSDASSVRGSWATGSPKKTPNHLEKENQPKIDHSPSKPSSNHRRDAIAADRALAGSYSLEQPWLDSQLTLTGSPVSDGWPFDSRPAAEVLEAMDSAVDAAATQLVRKALKFISLEDTPPRKSPAAAAGAVAPSPEAPSRSLLFKFDSNSFLGSGLDAITGVGKLVEGFAVTLDNAIGQAFEDWGTGTPQSAKRSPHSEGHTAGKGINSSNNSSSSLRGNAPKRFPRSKTPEGDAPSGTDVSPQSPLDAWGDFEAPAEDSASELDALPLVRSTNPKSSNAPQQKGTSSTSRRTASSEEVQQWRRRAQVLQRELQKLRTQRDEHQLFPENSSMRVQGTSSAVNSPDPVVSEQVMRQMEALLAEKAALAQENDRLLREKAGLQELLEFTMLQTLGDIGDDELFGSIEDGDNEYVGDEEEEEEDS